MKPGDTVGSTLTAIDDGWPITMFGITHQDVLVAISTENGLVAEADGAVSLVDSLVGYPLIANASNTWTTLELFDGTIKSDPGIETALVEAGNYLGSELAVFAEGEPFALEVSNARAPFYGHTGIAYRVTLDYEELSIYFAPGHTVLGTLTRESPTVTIPLTTTAPTLVPGSDGVCNATLTITVPTTATYNYHTGSVAVVGTLTKVGKNTWILNQDAERTITFALFQMSGESDNIIWTARDPDPPFNPGICAATITIVFLGFVG